MTDLRGADKASFVQAMFARISTRYDLMNRLMTFGLDQGWRRRVVEDAAVPAGGWALDLATGTGDIALTFPSASGMHVVGCDFCLPMLEIGREKAHGRPVDFVGGDALALPFAGGSFHAVTTGFAMRNVADIQAAFAEMLRVTRPGGRVVCLEVARPRNALLRWGHGFYFGRIVPLLGRIVSGQAAAYAYLPASAGRFPQPPELKAIMETAGWRQVRFILLGLGAVAIHVGVKG
jgi:demethylmenaquinone methyltransferase/2-methoxy-6-polyprenyl-1,4-benzoquinol methylase